MRAACLRGVALSCVILSSSCIVPADAQPDVSIGVDLANKRVHRGMVQTDDYALTTSAEIVIPAKQKGRIVLSTIANMDLTNDTGDAWLPNGHAGKFSQIDYNVLYEQQLGERALITGGFINYNLPNGLEFPLGERGATSEFMLAGTYSLPEDFFSLQPSLAMHYDFDEVEGFYFVMGLGHSHDVSEVTTLRSSFGLGWMDGDQTFWNYGQPSRSSGLADATLRVDVDHEIQQGTILTGFLAYSRIVDSELREWFDVINIDPTQLAIGAGVRWLF